MLILDLTVFDQIYHELSPFDPRFESECSRLKFLHRFEKEISKPILPEGEHLEYIPTQAFAEYLASHYKPRIDGVIYKSRIDGIIFSSPQTGGKGRNIVLLNHVAVVAAESNQSNEQDRFSKYRETWRDGDYSISELTQSPKVHKGRILLLIEDPPYGIPYSSKSNIDPSVKLVPNRLQVHRVMVKNEPQTEEQTLTFHIQTDTVHVQQKEKDGDL